MIKDLEPDTRGVTALRGEDGEQFEGIFWQLVMDKEFDPSEPGPVIEPMQPWDLEVFDPDVQYPRSLHEMMTLLQGGADAHTEPQPAESRRHDRLPGPASGDQDTPCAAAQWDYDVGAAVAVQREGSAGPAPFRDGELGAVDDQVEGAGVRVET